MQRRTLLSAIPMIASGGASAAQLPNRPGRRSDPDEPTRLPNGKLQQDEVLRSDHEKDILDARELAKLATELKDEIEKNDAHILSLGAIKKTEEIEKLAKKIRSRIRRY